MEMKKLNVVLRTCDRVSILSDRMVPKYECIKRCLRSLVISLRSSNHPFSLHIIDDNSSAETKAAILDIATEATIDFIPERDQYGLDSRQKSRHSVKVEYEYIDTLPEDELVYIVEDDYLHHPQSIHAMLSAWYHFTTPGSAVDVGIFPQDYRQLYYHPSNPFNETYVRPCMVYPGPDRYYRTTWYTQESFMIPISVIRRYREDFDELLKIGFDYNYWEGNTISKVWERPDVMMLMPLGTLAIHLGSEMDISYYIDWEHLWKEYA
jgi:hypothetical protein